MNNMQDTITINVSNLNKMHNMNNMNENNSAIRLNSSNIHLINNTDEKDEIEARWNENYKMYNAIVGDTGTTRY